MFYEKYPLIPINNAPVNNDVGDKHDGKEFMELSEYMKNICTQPYKFHETIDHLMTR